MINGSPFKMDPPSDILGRDLEGVRQTRRHRPTEDSNNVIGASDPCDDSSSTSNHSFQTPFDNSFQKQKQTLNAGEEISKLCNNRTFQRRFRASAAFLSLCLFWFSRPLDKQLHSKENANVFVKNCPNVSLSKSWRPDRIGLVSGINYVTNDGLWPDDRPHREKQHHNHNNGSNGDSENHNVKILGFTDKNYLPIAKVWYNRLTSLGYIEHYVVAHDDVAYDSLKSEKYRVIPCIIPNPDYGRSVQGLWQQIMSARLHLTRDLLRNGTHLLVTDVDNVFSRYVPLYGFIDEGYDVFHAYELGYPVDLYQKFGFVVCSGHQFLRSSPATLRFMDLVLKRCGGDMCDDQVNYNAVFHYDLNITWDNNIGTPNHKGALRVTGLTENEGLLIESVTGRSPVTNHTIKIWDRDFAWRLRSDFPKGCPSINNWVGMPTLVSADYLGYVRNKVEAKLAQFEAWDKYCLNVRRSVEEFWLNISALGN